MDDELWLADWRRSTAESYLAVRENAEGDPEGAWRSWVARRDALFRGHPQSPLAKERRPGFEGLAYYPYDPAWRLVGHPVEAPGAAERAALPEGELRLRSFAAVEFSPPARAEPLRLTLYWLEGYGGGLFLPFGDATNGRTTYGGGRYLYDTIKGADLGAGPTMLILDFNFAYNPSCAYSPQWVCPLPPRENRLAVAIEAGERFDPAGGPGRLEALR